jgi:hypothetical protein
MPDSTVYTPRFPNVSALREFRKNPDFQYKVDPQGKSLWARFIEWLLRTFEVKKGSFAEDFWTEYFWYILFAVVVGVLLYIFFKQEIRSFFYGSKKLTGSSLEVLNDDINAYDFDKEIRDAEAQENYRYALRLSYLKNLKALNDRGLIEWSLEKTNSDYLRELTNIQLQRIFGQCTYIFNWIWYGDFSVGAQEYKEAALVFQNFYNQIGSRA